MQTRTTRSRVFLTNIEVFGNVVKSIHHLIQNQANGKKQEMKSLQKYTNRSDVQTTAMYVWLRFFYLFIIFCVCVCDEIILRLYIQHIKKNN